MKIAIVVAAAENQAMGLDDRLPWRLPDDLRRFKALTLGKPVIMGRKTFDSIGKALPERLNIVVSRRTSLDLPGLRMAHSPNEALEIAALTGADEAMLIGGAELYRALLPVTQTIHLTRVHTHCEGDVFFPALDASEWREVNAEHHPADDRHAFAFTFQTLHRVLA